METLLNVEGMTCPSCIRHVTAALEDVEGVTGVEVKLREGKVTVKHVAGAKVVAFIGALKEAGYESRTA